MHISIIVCMFSNTLKEVCVGLCTFQVRGCDLRKRLHVDERKNNVMQNVDSVNPVELSDAVLELKHRDVVHRHPKHLLSAQDLHLQAERKMQPGDNWKLFGQRHQTLWLWSHLKWAPGSKWKGPLHVSLLCSPGVPNFMVTDHHLFAPLIEAGVDMKGNVVTSQKVHCEPVEDIFVPSSSVFLLRGVYI